MQLLSVNSTKIQGEKYHTIEKRLLHSRNLLGVSNQTSSRRRPTKGIVINNALKQQPKSTQTSKIGPIF